MKKLLIIIISFILIGCSKKDSLLDIYLKEVDSLNSVNNSSVNIPLVINIEVEKINDNLYNYRALINKNDEEMNNVKALLIHNKETDNIFPSIGIIDDKVDVLSGEKGIKLSGYVENIDNIKFKLLINYINKDKKDVKYYYIYDYSTINN